MTLATISGHTLTECRIHLPIHGLWWAECEIDTPEQLTGSVAIEVGGVAFAGTVMAGAPWLGRARYRVAGGAGGWGQCLPPRGYANDAGVRRRTVVADAATACGEAFEAGGDTATLGPAWARDAGPAARVLHMTASDGWYVDESGVTRLGIRPAVEYSGGATRMRSDLAQQTIVLAATELAELMPGVVVDGVSAVDVVHVVHDGTLRTTVWGDRGGGSCVRSALERFVAAATAELRYRGVWSYRVVSQAGNRLDLQRERVSSGMPDLLRVPIRMPPGYSADWAPGSMCLVVFLDGDPSRPVVVAGDDPDSPGFVPSNVSLDAEAGTGDVSLADGLSPVVRYGEIVTVGTETGVIAFTPGAPFVVQSRVKA